MSKLDDFLSEYESVDEYEHFYSKTTVKKMLKDLLELAAENAKIKTRYTDEHGNEYINLVDEAPQIDKESILNILEG